MLYSTLPNQSRVKTGKHVVEINEDEHGVQVRLADGTYERGDIVVGADGVHSKVRELMWEHVNALPPSKMPKAHKVGKNVLPSLFCQH